MKEEKKVFEQTDLSEDENKTETMNKRAGDMYQCGNEVSNEPLSCQKTEAEKLEEKEDLIQKDEGV